MAERSAVYTHRDVTQFLAQLQGKKIHRAAEIPVYALDRGFVEEVSQWIERRSQMVISITDRELYITVDERSRGTAVVEYRVG